MAPNKVLIPVLFLLLGLLFGGADGFELCRIDTKELDACRSAVTPPESQPSTACCSVVRRADLKCLCKYKASFPAMGINTADALALPPKCDVPLPRECKL